MGLGRVSDVTIDDIQKRRHPNKYYVYRIQVTWNDDAIIPVYRSYKQCLYLQDQLLMIKGFLSDLQDEGLGGARTGVVLQGDSFFGKYTVARRKHALEKWTLVEEFLKLVVRLSPRVSESEAVVNFFTPSFQDLHSPPGEYEEDVNNNWNRVRMRRSQKDKFYCHRISEPILLEQYVAIADYPKNKTSDLNLMTGNIVDVIEKNENGWWFVDLDGYLGWVPASYLEPRDGTEEELTVEIFEPGKEKVCITVQDFEAEFEDDVGCKIGEIVKVSQKNKDGWWLIKTRNKEGWAPAMYLREIAKSNYCAQHHGRDADKRKETMANTLLGLYGSRSTWKPRTRRTVETSSSSVGLSNKDPLYVNVEHPQKEPKACGKKRNRKAENPDAVRAQVGQAITRVDTTWEEKPTDDYQVEELVVYSTATEACARMSVNTTKDQHTERQLTTEPTEEPVLQTRPVSLISEENAVSRNSNPESQVSSRKSSPELSPILAQVVAVPRSSSEKEDNELSSFHENRAKKQNNIGNESEDTVVTNKESIVEKLHAGCAINKTVSPQRNDQDLKENIYYAICTYVKEDEDEVNLTEDAPVEVLEQSDCGWWRVRTQSLSVGWAPSNYLESLTSCVGEDEPPLKFEIHRADKCSIKPSRPPKTRHVKRMMKECEEENTWLYYQQKQRQHARKVSAVEIPDHCDEPSTSTANTPPSLRTDEVPCSVFEEHPKFRVEEESSNFKL